MLGAELLASDSYFAVIVGSVLLAMSVRWLLKDHCTVSDNLNSQRAVLITGCDSGFGFHAALLLDRLGYVVFAGCLYIDGAGASDLRRVASNRLVTLDMDVTNDCKVAGAKDVVEVELKSLKQQGLWAIVNNAGVYVIGELDWLTLDQCQHQIEVNLMGVIRVTKQFLPLVKTSKGRIINISSFSGTFGIPYRSVYCATKFGIEGFSDALRNELRKDGIQVAVIQPGNHCRLTNIHSNQEKHVEKMLLNMDEKRKSEVNDLFWRVQRLTKSGFLRGPLTFEDTSVLADIVDAVSSDVVKRRYVCGSWWDVKTFHVCKRLPSFVLDWFFRNYALDE